MSFGSRKSPTRMPLLPLAVEGAWAPPWSYPNGRSLSSNDSNSPKMPVIFTRAPFLPPASLLHLMDSSVAPPSWKENERPQLDPLQKYNIDRRAARLATMRSRSFRLGLESQRAYHHEPYPITSNSNGVVSPSPTELCLPPFDLPTSPKYKQSFAYTGLPGFPESPTFWLAMYFSFNLGLTLYNKGILVRFPFPYTLSAMHALFGTIGATLLAKQRVFVPSQLHLQEIVAVAAFSVLYSINIVVSNVSLQLVTVPFHQIVRAATPIFTILLSALFFGAESSRAKKISLIPVVAGVGLATFGDYYFTRAGFLLTLFGTLLAALKTIFTNLLQTPSLQSLSENPLSSAPPLGRPCFSNPLDLLYFLSPLAFLQCTFLAHVTGELERVHAFSVREMSTFTATALVVNGCIAFGLNVVSNSANRKVGALGMTVAANVKQVLTIVCAVAIFHLTITATNALGIALTLAGGAWYASIELSEKQRR